MPPVPADDDFGPLEMDAELWISEEMERIAWEQQLKRRCSRNTLIRVQGDGPDEYRSFTPAVKFTPEFAEPIPWRGQLGIRDVSDSLAARVSKDVTKIGTARR